jgi:hypothetical protein
MYVWEQLHDGDCEFSAVWAAGKTNYGSAEYSCLMVIFVVGFSDWTAPTAARANLF